MLLRVGKVSIFLSFFPGWLSTCTYLNLYLSHGNPLAVDWTPHPVRQLTRDDIVVMSRIYSTWQATSILHRTIAKDEEYIVR